MDSQKQQAAERIKQANNILVTVSNNPSVDQLAACIGLTLALNKMGKHATAVFSGEVPSTIEFLQPEKTLEKNTDSLRDFIIALDKSKADKLRYKVEDRVVKIFITPYRTSINEKDLEFSQGDFNVDVVLALGVHNQADLDQAITSHGRILHDATVVTMNIKPGGELGSINWLDPNASSLSELSTQLIDALDKKLIDGQIATAMLTGIVAETERFSNAKTTPQTMSISAELMGSGANQQLVATKLEEPAPPPPPPSQPIAAQEGEKSGEGEKPAEEAKKPDDGTLEITHDEKPAEQPAPQEESPKEDDTKPAEESHKEEQTPEGTLEPAAEEHKHEEPYPTTEEPEPQPAPKPVEPPQIHIDEHGSLSPLEDMLPPRAPSEPPAIIRHSESPKMVLEPPTLGGQLTASASPGFGEPMEGGSMPDQERPSGMPSMGQTIMPPNPEDEEAPSGGAPRSDSFLVGSGEPVAPQASTPVIVPPTGSDQPMAQMPQMVVTPSGATPDVSNPAVNQESPLGAGRTLSDIEKDVHSTHLEPLNDAGPAAAAPSGPMLPPMPSADATIPDMPTPANPTPVASSDSPSLPAFDLNNLPTSDVATPAASAQPADSTSPSSDEPMPNLNSARDAVAQAIGSSPNLDPIQSLNANPLELPSAGDNTQAPSPAVQPWTPPTEPQQPPAPAEPQPTQSATLPQFDPAMFGAQENDGSDTNAPPPVPPPMMPPSNPY